MAEETPSPAVTMAEQAATTAGMVTTVAGVALILAPARCGARIGMEHHAGVLRTIGITDLIVAPGLLAGRPRWPWLLARAALNVGLVAVTWNYRDDLGDLRSRIGVGQFAVLTVIDGASAAVLRSAGR